MNWGEVINVLRGKSGLEFGGTTELFKSPMYGMHFYPFVKLDGANKFDNNHFNKISGAKYLNGVRFNCDATDENQIKAINKKYDFIVTSHVIEHIANPIKAIKLWSENLLNDGGYILSIIPDYKECFDRKRPLTTIEHLIKDFENNIGEDDITHIEEQKKLHDWKLGGHKDFYKLCENNSETRVVHHHTFTIHNVRELFEHMNMEIVLLFKHDPLNIVCLTKLK